MTLNMARCSFVVQRSFEESPKWWNIAQVGLLAFLVCFYTTYMIQLGCHPYVNMISIQISRKIKTVNACVRVIVTYVLCVITPKILMRFMDFGTSEVFALDSMAIRYLLSVILKIKLYKTRFPNLRNY